MSYISIIKNGIVKENPTFVLMLGMCPTLATTTSAMNGMSMGLATMAVLICTNVVISLLKSLTPDKVRIPVFIVVIAAFVTALQLVIKAFLPDIDKELGLFIPLIVVNCIILGRAEAYANKHTPLLSVMDGIGMGLGFTIALTLAGAIRELLGAGKIFGAQILPEGFGMTIFIQPPGAFLVFALIIAVMNAIGIKTRQRQLVESACDGNCALCTTVCGDQKEETAAPEEAQKALQEAPKAIEAAAKGGETK